MTNLSDIRNKKFSKFYNPSEHLAIDEGIVKYKGRVCDETGYTYDMTVYLGRDRQRTVQHLTATHMTLSELTKYEDVAKNCVWTVTSHPQTYSITWP